MLPDGGYGWSNAGLVAGDEGSLLVDTLFDLPLTREMLDAMAPITDRAPITDALITHSNGDHTHGNQLLDASVRIIAAKGTAEEIAHGMAPEMLVMAQTADLGPVATPYAARTVRALRLQRYHAAQRRPDLRRRPHHRGRWPASEPAEPGPAHTAADSVVHVPDAGVLFAGRSAVHRLHADRVGRSDRQLGRGLRHDDRAGCADGVPGHGPVTDPDGIRAVRGYLVHVSEQADAAYRKGLSLSRPPTPSTSASMPSWLDAERVVVNVYQRYRELDPGTPQLPVMGLLAMQAEWLAKHS